MFAQIVSKRKPVRSDPPHRGEQIRRATRQSLIAHLREENDRLRRKLARAEAWAEMVESECDVLRHLLGYEGVPE